jgi:RNA polymerase sigma factor (sigma-70 family)
LPVGRIGRDSRLVALDAGKAHVESISTWPATAIRGTLDHVVTTLDDHLWALALERAAAAPAPTNLLRDLLWRSLHLSGWRPQAASTGARAPATTDRALLERFVHGDPEAFETLVERHGGALVGFARRSLPDEYADDAVQEAFLALFTKAHDVLAATDRNVRGFLFASTRMEVSKSLGLRLRDEGPPEALLAVLPPAEPDLLERLRACERSELATLLLDVCDALEQHTILMRLEGRASTDIAAELELEPGHVHVLEHRAGTKLTTALDRSAS